MVNKNGPLVFTYTRREAIEDGILVDISKIATEAGIKYPAAITINLWNKYIKPTEELDAIGQSIDGRLWDLLLILRSAIKSSPDSSILYFDVLFLMAIGDEPKPKSIKAICHPGDQNEPVLTFMLPWED